MALIIREVEYRDDTFRTDPPAYLAECRRPEGNPFLILSIRHGYVLVEGKKTIPLVDFLHLGEHFFKRHGVQPEELLYSLATSDDTWYEGRGAVLDAAKGEEEGKPYLAQVRCDIGGLISQQEKPERPDLVQLSVPYGSITAIDNRILKAVTAERLSSKDVRSLRRKLEAVVHEIEGRSLS